MFNFSLNALMLFLVVVPFVGFGGTIREIPEDYSWNTKNVEDTLVTSAKWIRDNTPEDARVGADQPGALAYFSDREVVDYSGKSFPDAIGKTTFDLLKEEGLDYAFSFDSIYLKSWPPSIEVQTFEVGRNTIMQGPEFIGYELDFDREVVLAPASTPYQIDFQSRLLEVIDAVDVANQSAERSEAEQAHEYVVVGPSSSDSRPFRIDDETTLQDDFRTYVGAEEFTVASSPGERLLVAKRYDAAVGQTVRVFANGQEVGLWELPRKSFFFGEEIFVIPGEFITGPRTELRFEFVPTPGSDSANSFFYWILKDAT